MKNRGHALLFARTLWSAVLALALSTSQASAQAPRNVPERPGWLLFPSFRVAGVYEDNVLFTEPALDSWLTRLSPGLDVLYRRDSRHFEAGYTFDAERYPERFDTLNDVFARQEGYAELRTLLNRRSSLVVQGAALSTSRPEEVLRDTGLLSLRRRSRGITANALFTRILTRRLSWDAGYAFSLRDFERPEGLAPRLGGTVHSFATGPAFRHSTRMTSAANYTLRLFIQDEIALAVSPVNEFVSHVATYRWSGHLSRKIEAVLALGPRFSEGLRVSEIDGLFERTNEVAPEAFASVAYRGDGKQFTARYTRSQSQAFGLSGFVDTENAVFSALFELGPRLRIEANPGIYQNQRAGITTKSYQTNVTAEYRFSSRASVETSYLFQYQDRLSSVDGVLGLTDDGITRNTVLFGLKLFTILEAN